MKRFISVKAYCPYYEDESTPTVRCAGMEPEQHVWLTFSTRAAAKDYKANHCYTKDCEKCAVYRMLEEYAEDER